MLQLHEVHEMQSLSKTKSALSHYFLASESAPPLGTPCEINGRALPAIAQPSCATLVIFEFGDRFVAFVVVSTLLHNLAGAVAACLSSRFLLVVHDYLLYL